MANYEEDEFRFGFPGTTKRVKASELLIGEEVFRAAQWRTIQGVTEYEPPEGADAEYFLRLADHAVEASDWPQACKLVDIARSILRELGMGTPPSLYVQMSGYSGTFLAHDREVPVHADEQERQRLAAQREPDDYYNATWPRAHNASRASVA